MNTALDPSSDGSAAGGGPQEHHHRQSQEGGRRATSSSTDTTGRIDDDHHHTTTQEEVYLAVGGTAGAAQVLLGAGGGQEHQQQASAQQQQQQQQEAGDEEEGGGFGPLKVLSLITRRAGRTSGPGALTAARPLPATNQPSAATTSAPSKKEVAAPAKPPRAPPPPSATTTTTATAVGDDNKSMVVEWQSNPRASSASMAMTGPPKPGPGEPPAEYNEEGDEDEDDGDAYIASTHEFVLKDFSKTNEPPSMVLCYRVIGWVILISEVLIMVEAMLESIKCSNTTAIPWKYFWLAVPSCGIYAAGTAIDEYYQYELVRPDIKKSRRVVWLTFRTLLAAIQLLMLMTCAAVMGNSSDVLSLVSNYLGVQVITQVDEIFAVVMRVPNPEKDFYVREDQQDVSRRVSLIAKRKELFWALLGLTTFFAFMIRSPIIGCVREDGSGGGGGGAITSCGGVFSCFDAATGMCPFSFKSGK